VDRVEITPVGVWPLLATMMLLLLGSALRASRWGVIP
jgi:hypothetical protein